MARRHSPTHGVEGSIVYSQTIAQGGGISANLIVASGLNIVMSDTLTVPLAPCFFHDYAGVPARCERLVLMVRRAAAHKAVKGSDAVKTDLGVSRARCALLHAPIRRPVTSSDMPRARSVVGPGSGGRRPGRGPDSNSAGRVYFDWPATPARRSR